MILLTHKKGRSTAQVKRNGKSLDISGTPSKLFWKLARQFPEETLIWVEQDLEEFLEPEKVLNSISHERMMASYAVYSKFLPENIGYIDQLPFININPAVKYPTWRMSSDVGGIRAKTLLSFEKDLSDIKDLDLLLNSVGKIGQQNGLFCYSDPGLLPIPGKPVAGAGDKELFSFVYRHYKSIWIFVLFFCLARYESRFPVMAFFRSFFHRKLFGKQVDLPQISTPGEEIEISVDVIIPTLGRPQYLEQVVQDLSRQTLMPKRVIVVEQNPGPDSTSELTQMLVEKWPFEMIHIFTHEPGACRARNKALKEVRSQWTFFADDDIRLPNDLLENTVNEAARLRVDCLNLNCKQKGESTIFKKIKQWGSFGSGTSMVKSRYAMQNTFSEAFEHGYGEDAEYGMKLRNSGCDIIYHPNLEILHLKAPVGGFRKKPVWEWEKEDPKPKPSPTLMILGKRNFTTKQMKGFKISLYLKFFRKQKTKNPWTYLKNMEQRWKRSEYWSEQLLNNEYS